MNGEHSKRLQYSLKEMLNFHRRLFNDYRDEGRIVSASDHNKQVLKQMITMSPLSSAMMIIILVMFILCQVVDLVHGKVNLSVISPGTLLHYGANSNKLVNEGQIFRLITAIFLHSGVMHLVANSSSFLLFLMPVEQRLRKKHLLYLAVLLIGGMMGNILSVNVFNLRGKQLLAVGASTAICSVIGFDFAYRILRVDNQQLQMRRIGITLLYTFIISIMPGVDFYGHFGSMIGGFLIGSSFLPPSDQYWSDKQIKMIKGVSLLILIAYSGTLLYFLFKFMQ